jgi:GTP-binding protein Era
VNEKAKAEKHSGFVSIVGRPNVGKSTLLNRLVGEKLAGVSPKPQTTRGPVRGILSRPEGQAVFLDTPGLHSPRDPLGRWMVQEIEKSLEGADLIYWMVMPVMPEPGADEDFLKLLSAKKMPVFLLVNQVDRFPKPEVLPVLDHYQKIFDFRELIPISAAHGDQVDVLIAQTFPALPAAEPYFPEDQISDQNERFIVGEMIREKIFQLTHQEIPYGTAVIVEEFQERNERLVAIGATVVVEKDSHKGIVLGQRGEMMKRIGQRARQDIERFLGKKVYLEMWVKVMPGWRQDEQSLKKLGYG